MAQETFQLRTYVSASIRKKLKVIAAQEDITIAELLRNSVQEYLTKRGIEIDMMEGLDGWGGNRHGEKDQ